MHSKLLIFITGLLFCFSTAMAQNENASADDQNFSEDSPASTVSEDQNTDGTSDQSLSDVPDVSADKKIKEPVSDKPMPQPSGSASGKPQWEIGAGTVTVNNEQWTRIALGVDVPIWKFGVFFDLELFIDNEGQFSDKGWNFKDDWVEALTRKIRYIRFGYEQDPLFIKFGGLSDVTLGYGFLVDRFTNMLHYPDQKLLGLQFYLNDIGPIGLTLQTMLADFKDFGNDGGVFAARLAFTPMKSSKIPIVNGISIGGTYAMDINQLAPARDWEVNLPASVRQLNYLVDMNVDSSEAIDSIASWSGDDPIQDNDVYEKEKKATEDEDPFSLIGGDIGVPLIRTSLLNLDLYGQAGIRGDGKHGWGIGAPGVALKVWKLWANLEYRHVQGKFTPGYFGTYYLDERVLRKYASDPKNTKKLEVSTKESRIPDDDLNGIYGRLGFNIADALIIDGAYQYLLGKEDEDQRFEATASLGDIILSKIPKINKAEAYIFKTNIGTVNDAFFEKSEFMYWGYRAGLEISKGASLIWDSRYGYKKNDEGKLVSDNFISVQTAITF